MADARAALEWLALRPPQIIVAPAAVTGSGYSLSVPNNALDIVAKAWCRGNESGLGDANPATHRTMKTVRPMLLLGEAVHYLWPVPDPITDDISRHLRVLSGIARSVVALGWGVDLAVSRGGILSQEQAGTLLGERWLPVDGTARGGLRVPTEGTLEDLVNHHSHFLKRIGPSGFIAPPAVSVYRRVDYRRATDPPTRSAATFSLLKLDASGFRPFHTSRRALTVAGMARSAAAAAAVRSGWPQSKIQEFVLGHREPRPGGRHVPVGPRRFAYLPLPSLDARDEGRSRVVGSVRRVMLASFADDCAEEVEWARRALSGQDLVDENTKQPVALLSLIPESEKVVRRYTRPAAEWATVTPVVLPGYDDPKHYRRRISGDTDATEQEDLLRRLEDRIDGLLRKAIVQAGLSEVLADHAELEWRKGGFWAGVDLAERYGVPDHLRRFPRLHVRIQWRDSQGGRVAIPGPICLGGGRFYGLGLFAAI
jgi:CRISPR-associated protein Csb2